MSPLSSPHLLLVCDFLCYSCPAASSRTQTPSIHIHSSLSPHIQLQIMELTGPLTGRREGANMSDIRQDSLRGVEGTKEERRGGEGRRRGEEGTSYWNGNRTGQLKHFTGSLFASPAQLSQIIYTAHYGVMNMYKLNSSIITPPLGLN